MGKCCKRRNKPSCTSKVVFLPNNNTSYFIHNHHKISIIYEKKIFFWSGCVYRGVDRKVLLREK